MADNLNGIPFSSKDEGIDFPTQAINAVKRSHQAYFEDKAIEAWMTTTANAYVVWFAYVLGGWKALVSTDRPDGRYYEVTFNNAKQEVYVDTYVKTKGTVLQPEELL